MGRFIELNRIIEIIIERKKEKGSFEREVVFSGGVCGWNFFFFCEICEFF